MDLAAALKIIDLGEVFSCKVVSYDAERKTGGQIKDYSELVISRKKAERDNTPLESTSKVQNHYEHFTRNTLKCVDGITTSIYCKIHILFLLEVNGETVKL
jgi:hypothetical protein